MYKNVQVILLFAVTIAVVTAKSVRFDSDTGGNEQENNLLETSGLTNSQLDILAQRLADYNNQLQSQIPSAWERFLIRSPEIKRQNRRYCYFNPVSCFRK